MWASVRPRPTRAAAAQGAPSGPCASTSRRRCARGTLVAWAQSAQRRTHRSRAVAPSAAGPRDARPRETLEAASAEILDVERHHRRAQVMAFTEGRSGRQQASAGMSASDQAAAATPLLSGNGRRDPTALLVTSCHARPGGADAEMPPLARAITPVQRARSGASATPARRPWRPAARRPRRWPGRSFQAESASAPIATLRRA